MGGTGARSNSQSKKLGITDREGHLEEPFGTQRGNFGTQRGEFGTQREEILGHREEEILGHRERKFWDTGEFGTQREEILGQREESLGHREGKFWDTARGTFQDTEEPLPQEVHSETQEFPG